MGIIIGRQGTQKTPISDPTVSRRHCKVTDNGDGTYVIENLSTSGTKVDGKDILRTTASLNSTIQLGPSYCKTLGELIGVSQSEPNPSQANKQGYGQHPGCTPGSSRADKTFNISHLQRVWEEYNNTNVKMADSQRKTNLIRAGLSVFTLSAMVVSKFGPIGWVLTGIGILGNIYSFVGMKNAETAAQRQHRQDEFDDAWVCPNPECGHSLPARNYRMLVRNHQMCPYCKCKYVER